FPTKIFTGCPFWANAIIGSHKIERHKRAIGHDHQPRGARKLRGASTLAGTCAQRYLNHASDGVQRHAARRVWSKLCRQEPQILAMVANDSYRLRMPGLLAWAAAPVQGRYAEAERQSHAASGRRPSWERCSAPSIPTSPQRGRTTRLCGE